MSLTVSDGYVAYLRSPEWEKKRQERLRADGYRCTGCDETERLEVHHLTYQRLGHERLTDLLTLCDLCHAREHGRSPRLGPVAGATVGELTERVRDRETQENARDLLKAAQDVERACDALLNVCWRAAKDPRRARSRMRVLKHQLGRLLEDEIGGS